MTKKLVSFLLVMALLVTMTATASAVKGTDAIGYVLQVTKKCNVRSGPDSGTRHIGEVSKGNTYRIYGAVKNSDTGSYWYLIHAKSREVWISSKMVKVDSHSRKGLSGSYEGWCVVKNASSKVHRSYSSNTARLWIAYEGDGYIVYDREIGDDGNWWLLIHM